MPDGLEIALRTLLAVVVRFLMTKLLGKRQFMRIAFQCLPDYFLGMPKAWTHLLMESVAHWKR